MTQGSRQRLALAAVFCAIPLLNFPLALVSDRTLFTRDIGVVWAPQIEAVVRQVARGEFPYFDARRGFGQALYADPRSEVLYPPAWLHWVLPPDRSYSIFAALHVLIAALGAARLARRLVPSASFAAQAVAGIAYGAGGPILSLVSNWHHLAAAAWMPWVIERVSGGPGERIPWLSLSCLVTLQVLAGSPDYTLTTLLLCAMRLLTRSDRSAKDCMRLGLCLILGITMSAIQLLPSYFFAREAARDAFPIGWAISPLHPVLTIETILPVRIESWPLRPEAATQLLGDAQVWMFSHYLGLTVWALAALGLWRAERMDRRFALGAILMGIIFSWGIRNESLQSLIAHVPFVSGLRFPTKHLAASSLGLALLAAFGTTAPLIWTSREKKRVLLLVAGIIAAGIVLFVWAKDAERPVDIMILWRPLLAASCVLFAIGGGDARRRILLPAVVAIDLLAVHSALNPTTPSWAFRDRPPLAAVIPAGSRIYVSDYSIRIPAASIRLPETPAYRLRNVPRGFTHAESLTLAATWYLNPPMAGRFGYFGSFDLDILDFYPAQLKKVTEDFVTSRDAAFVVDRLRRGSVDYVVTMDPPALWNSLPLVTEEARFFEAPVRVFKVTDGWSRARYETSAGALHEGSPKVSEMRDGRIRVETSASEPVHLVLAVARDPSFRATVDGVSVSLAENEMAFLSVPVSAGRHLVEFVYRPRGLEAGVSISLASLAIVVALAFRQHRSDVAMLRDEHL